MGGTAVGGTAVGAGAADDDDDATDEDDEATDDATDEDDEATGGLVAAGAAEDDDATGTLVAVGAAVGAAHAARANKTTSRENNRTSLRECITSPPLISCTWSNSGNTCLWTISE